MSKHFELMQQMERDGSLDSRSLRDSARPDTTKGRKPRWASDEALRLVQQIFLLQTQEPPHIVTFAGVDHGNGCSEVCASVAEALAKSAQKPVCLVDANFRSPAQTGLFGVAGSFGFTDALLGVDPISSFVQEEIQDNLWLLPSGSTATDSPALLASESLRSRLIELRQRFEFIIIDAPPLSLYWDAIKLSQLSDGLVMVLEANATRRESAISAAAKVHSVDVPILAAVLNKRTYPIPGKIFSKL